MLFEARFSVSFPQGPCGDLAGTNGLKVLLAEKNMTNKQLAAGLKVREGTVSRWCTNDSQPSLETCYKIAKLLDVDVRELLIRTKK
jgi:DNA-binding XRE family transcriptional regulator